MSWFVMYVETGHEDEVCRLIDRIIVYSYFKIPYQLLVPKRQIYEKKSGICNEVTKCLFPGYILVETEQIDEFYYQVKKIPHIFKFLRILYMTNEEGLIEISNALYINDRIEIIDGPLKGYEGIIRKLDKRKGRAKVEFSINQNVIHIDLGISIIYKKEFEYTWVRENNKGFNKD